MGKYSLENYEIYKTRKIRPLFKTPPANSGRGQINYITCSWAELEPKRGCYELETLLDKAAKTFNPVLVIKPDYPKWVTDYPEECFAGLIRRTGSYFKKKDISLAGVMIFSIRNNPVEWNAYMEGFQEITLFADLDNYGLIRFLKDKNREFGLRISCGEENWIRCCEALAEQGLQNNWQRKPALLHVLDPVCGVQVKRQSSGWHCGFSNQNLDLGFQIMLRRLTYPKTVSSMGVLPARFWFVNTGSAPCYGELSIKLKLVRGDETFLIPVTDSPSWHIGDIIHNEIIQLPSLLEGSYSLSAGLFYKQQLPVYMGIDGECGDGFYQLGELEVDHTNRDSLKNVWEHYYPEGYYPLEDPAAPENPLTEEGQ